MAVNSHGILLINLGTPASPSVADVRRYLAQFLSDPFVIDLPAPLRWILLHGIILRFRPRKSAHAYRSVWTDRGSPLLFHTEDLSAALQKRFDEGGPDERVVVRHAMRYGKPSIADICEEFRQAGVTSFHAVPLYPQFAGASTATVMADLFRSVMQDPWHPLFHTVELPFWDEAGYADLWAGRLRAYPSGAHFLFSFHGLPVRQIMRSGDSECMRDGCCDRHPPPHCYRAQCIHSARRVADAAGIAPDHWSIAYQSRLGRAEWLTPSAEQRIQQLALKGIPVVVVPLSFVADCLETLEELAIRGAEIYRSTAEQYGVQGQYAVVPSLNADDDWVNFLFGLLKKRVNAMK